MRRLETPSFFTAPPSGGGGAAGSETKTGSKPVTMIAGVAQLVRAPACHAGGRGFKSRHSRHFLIIILSIAARPGLSFSVGEEKVYL